MANIITTLALEMSENWYVSKKLNSVGRVGENTVTKLTIEPTEILNATYEIEIMSADGSKNVAELTIDGTELYLILTANMLTTSGITKMQVRAVFEDGSIKKSNIFELKVNRSISATDYYEEYAVTIFDQLVQDCRDIIEGAESYAIRAETAAVNAEAYEQSASASAEAASASASTASTASTAAVNAATSAENSATSAHTSAETATTAANSASASANTAQTSAQTATSASTAAQSASETAQTASTTATTAATNAETAANTATTAANNASTSATSAATSASNAAISETNASTSAANASTSETNAASSATSAANSATSASTSATNAANSAVAAATSATNAHNSEVNASTSETNAGASAAEAEASAESIAASVAQINENTYRINDLEAIIGGYQLTDLPTGTVASIADGTALLMPSLKVGIEPVQDLHGYDHPWAGGAGKNLLEVTATTQTLNGVTFTANTDGTINISGTATAGVLLMLNTVTLPEGNYIVSGGVSNNCYINVEGKANSYGADNSFSVASGGETVNVRLYIVSGTTASGTFKPMIRLATETDATFEPYSNICPISGWTAANVMRTGKNLIYESDRLISPSASGASITYAKTNGIILKAGNSYTFSITGITSPPNGIYFRKLAGNSVIAVAYDKNSVTATITEDIVAYMLVLYNQGQTQDAWQNIKAQVELGSTATTYEPYNGQTYTVQFTDGDNPLTVYGGTLDVTTGELVVDRGYLTNDYLVNTANFESAGRNCFILIGVALKTLGASVVDSKLIASALKTDTQDHLYSNYYTGIAHWWNTRIGFSTGDSNITSISAFKKWLALNGSDVCYGLATPTTYQLTPTQVRTLVGNNNIWADTGDVLSGKYFKEL